MREQEVRELYEAYMQVHQVQEEVEHLDEFAPGLQKFVDDATKKGGNILRQIPGVAAVLSTAGKGKRTVTAGEQKANIKQNVPLKNSFDPFDAILEHLVAEGYADTNESALAIMANMSEEWKEEILDEAAADQSDKQIDKGVKTTYKAQNVLDNLHQGRSRGVDRVNYADRDAKVKRMRGRLKTRRDDLFGERNKREDESRAEMKKKYGI